MALVNDETRSDEYQNSTIKVQLYCDLCHDDGNQVTAFSFCVNCNDYLCAKCYRVHRGDREYKNHVLKYADNLPVCKPREHKGQERCTDHPDEPLKWYCKSHDQVVCDVCRQIDHRRCIELSTLSDVSQNVLSSEKLNQLEVKLRTFQADFQENKTRVVKNKNSVDSYYDELIESVTKHISKIRENDSTKMAGLLLTCDTVTASIKSHLGELKTLRQNEDNERVFLLMKKVESQLPAMNSRLDSLKRDNKIQGYKYVTDASFGSSIGKIITSPVKDDDIEVKTSSDRKTCWISGMEKLSDNRLVVADRNNSKIKLIDMKTKSIISKLKLKMSPLDLTKVDDHKIAVTTFDNKKLLLVSVSDKLTIQETIDKTEYSYCTGIVYGNDSLIVSYYGPYRIEILDIDGFVKRRIDNKDEDGTVIFENVLYIAQSRDTQTKIVSMTLEGKIISGFTHALLKHPRGMTIGRDGRLFVCSLGNNKIFEICPDLSKGEIILDEKDGISSPCSILYDDAEDILYVGGHICNKIQMYRCLF